MKQGPGYPARSPPQPQPSLKSLIRLFPCLINGTNIDETWVPINHPVQNIRCPSFSQRAFNLGCALIATRARYTETISRIPSLPAVTDGIPINEPNISLIKECSASSNTAPSNITYTVENTGDSDLFDVTVYGETLALTILGPIDLAMGEEETGEHTLLDMSQGTYTNTLVATVSTK